MKFLGTLLVSTLTLSANAVASTPLLAQQGYGPTYDQINTYLIAKQYYQNSGAKPYPGGTVKIDFSGTSSDSSCYVKIGLKNAATGQEYYQGIYTTPQQFNYFFVSVPAGNYKMFAANTCATASRSVNATSHLPF